MTKIRFASAEDAETLLRFIHALADYELLELILFRSLPRIDTKPIAKNLLARFGSFGDVLSADM